MGRSTASCFKIIACGGDSVDKDDAGAAEGKGSSDKRGWSFRKKSPAHRVLSSTVISEFPSSSVKEQPETANAKLQTQLGTTSVETANVKLQTQPDSVITEKSSVIPWTEENVQSFDPVISTTPDTKYAKDDDTVHTAPDTKYAKEDDTVHTAPDTKYAEEDDNVHTRPDTKYAKEDDTEDTTPDTKYAKEADTVHKVIPDEYVIRIQGAIRKYLAQRETVRLKNVIKLQAAVRGHLVRRHAVGTLRCVQAIVKMQALVRARRVCVSSEGSWAKEKQDENPAKSNLGSNLLENGTSATKQNSSIEKLLSNKFAHQLLETAPSTKRIHIKCEPSKLDSAWIWLGRWMTALSVTNEQPRELDSVVELQGLDKVEGSVSQSESGSPSEGFKANSAGEVLPSKSDENVIAPDVDNSDFLPSQSIPSSKSDNQEIPNTENSQFSDSRTSSLDLLANQNEIADMVSQEEVKTGSSKAEVESELSRSSVKVPEQVETEENKVSVGTRKATNPAFIAAQSKFKELSSTGNSTRSTSFSQDVGVEVSSDAGSSVLENGKRAREVDESSVQNNSRNKFGGSECGTELSISSTLDSPDRREAGEMDDHEVTSNPNSHKNVAETNNECTIEEPNLSSYSTEVQSEKVDAVGDAADVEPINSVPSVDSLQEVQKLDVNEPDVQNNLQDTVQMHKSTPEGSPRSHMTVPEFQETPSSQISVRAERTKSGDRGSSKQKRKSMSAAHKSPSNSNHDSSVRSSLEQLPKESKSGKRRNSFGSVKTDYVDQEPRDSSSSSTLPSYMQATESARAKALPNSSPRSSPDVTKDVQVKKRHSLPGANGRQVSPQIQRSASQTKGSSQPPERKWQR